MVSNLSERSSADYSPEDLALVLDACRNVATALGDKVTHAIVIGGLVPSLLIETPATGTTHVGTVDLDLGLQLGLTEDDFRRMPALLDDAGFERAPNRTRRWLTRGSSIPIDLVVAEQGRSWTRTLPVAFLDVERPTRSPLRVCGPAAYTVLKAGAFRDRRPGKIFKDAYDLYYVLANYCSGSGVLYIFIKG